MCDFDYNAHAPAGKRIAADESKGARTVRQQAEADNLHPLFADILRPFCADIAEKAFKENEKGGKHE